MLVILKSLTLHIKNMNDTQECLIRKLFPSMYYAKSHLMETTLLQFTFAIVNYWKESLSVCNKEYLISIST